MGADPPGARRRSAAARWCIVDDGSADDTWSEIVRLAEDGPGSGGPAVPQLRPPGGAVGGDGRGPGQSVCFLDADLQDPPELLIELVEPGGRARGGLRHPPVAQGRRGQAAAYRAFYRLYRRLANIDVLSTAATSRSSIAEWWTPILALPEHNRFLRGLGAGSGSGRSGWSTTATLATRRAQVHNPAAVPTRPRRAPVVLRGAAPARVLPRDLGRLAGGLYIGVALVCAAILRWRAGRLDVDHRGRAHHRGMQLIVIGVLGEYVARIYDETKARPNFLVGDEPPRLAGGYPWSGSSTRSTPSRADHWWFVARRTILASVSSATSARTERRILDVGCGTGGMLPVLARFGTVQGLEGDRGGRALPGRLRRFEVR